MTAMDEWHVDELFATIRSRGAFRRAGPRAFEGVLDMLSGRTLRRVRRAATARHVGSRGGDGRRRAKARSGSPLPTAARFQIAACSACFCSAPPGAARVGELDEEMVFESRVGETFVLGASSWRIEEITHDRVLVSPAPASPARCRSGKAIRPAGRWNWDSPSDVSCTNSFAFRPAAIERLTREHDLDRGRPRTCCNTSAIRMSGDARRSRRGDVVMERVRDELGDWRICVLSPRGGRSTRHGRWLPLQRSGRNRHRHRNVVGEQ